MNENLKKHSNVKYEIKEKQFKIGDLSDNQLEMSIRILKKKHKPTEEQINQLIAAKYILKLRSDRTIGKMHHSISERMKDKAYKTAGVITDWIFKVTDTKIGKTGKFTYIKK